MKFYIILLTFTNVYDRIQLEFHGKGVELMNYEKIIVELLGRIQTLEEQVAILMDENNSIKNEVNIVTMNDIREYILDQKRIAKEMGKNSIELRSGDIHNDLGLKHRHPMVCNAMRQCMNPGDIILYQPPKGNGTTLRIEYKF